MLCIMCIIYQQVELVNPSEAKFTDKYLRLGIEDCGFRGGDRGKNSASNVELPGNSDHNFSESPAGKQSVPFIRFMPRTALNTTAEKVPKRSNSPNTVFGSKAVPAGPMSIAARQIIAHILSAVRFFPLAPTISQSGYSQSASLLAHNRVAASQLIRSGLYHS